MDIPAALPNDPLWFVPKGLLPLKGMENSHHFTISCIPGSRLVGHVTSWLYWESRHGFIDPKRHVSVFLWQLFRTVAIWFADSISCWKSLTGLKLAYNKNELLAGRRGGEDGIAITGALTSVSEADAADCSPPLYPFQTSDYVNSGKPSLLEWNVYHGICWIWNDYNEVSIDKTP